MRAALLRLSLYIALWLCSALLFVLTIVRLNYTLHLPKGDPLNGGTDFYDPIVVELLVCSLLALGLAPLVLNLLGRYLSNPFTEVSTPVIEVIALGLLWLLWVIGAGVASSIWPSLSFCYNFAACRVLAAMTAFAWLGWLAICGLLVVGMFPFFQKKRDIGATNEVDWVIPTRTAPTAQV
ncbi:hypothetical protein WOLCODRAFT_101178 [Wolfiporia cocos MD-104 SS10]|uniref:MARVEL domain-containing protein n=1 Tax=Wolfiporia cocos (strain MD-104) TaxID=742152 RepID=A0A2H3JHU7_WOLCO|nr:hypothetical protein WOLCODRAFT_101178 [Wolfiporia cocos MD-104 SS10]